jgi:hypothetical protein
MSSCSATTRSRSCSRAAGSSRRTGRASSVDAIDRQSAGSRGARRQADSGGTAFPVRRSPRAAIPDQGVVRRSSRRDRSIAEPASSPVEAMARADGRHDAVFSPVRQVPRETNQPPAHRGTFSGKMVACSALTTSPRRLSELRFPTVRIGLPLRSPSTGVAATVFGNSVLSPVIASAHSHFSPSTR